jgi:hypothetical protein
VTTTRTPVNHCPFCREVVGAATSIVGHHAPRVDDYAVCWNCGNLLVVNPDLTVREASLRVFLRDHAVSPESKRRMLRVREAIRLRGPLATRSELAVFRPN